MASTTSSSLQAITFRIHLHLWMLVTHIIDSEDKEGKVREGILGQKY